MNIDELRETFSYDPETGLITNLITNYTYSGKTEQGYISLPFKGKFYVAHRIAWAIYYGRHPKQYIDHINHIRHDNRLNNLREVSHQENRRNSSKQKRTTATGHSNINWCKRRNRYRVRFKVDYKDRSFGYFSNLEEAIEVRNRVKKELGFHDNHGT